MPAHFDTDPWADPAVYETATGNWEFLLSLRSYITERLPAFGGAGWTPLAADFDGCVTLLEVR